MTEAATTHEISFLQAIEGIEAAHNLTAEVKRHWTCSLRQIAKALDRAIETIPARWTAIRGAVSDLHHSRVGGSPKTLANHKSNVRGALRWLGKEHDVPARGVPLTPAWEQLKNGVQDKGQRARLYGLMRYCSAKGIVPSAVDDLTLELYLRYRAETTALPFNPAAHRSAARTWNACGRLLDGWPPTRLTEPPLNSKGILAWDEFPVGLQHDVEAHLESLRKRRRGVKGKRLQGCSQRTIEVHRAELQAFARMAVRQGVPRESLTSLAALANPVVVEKVIEAYWQKNGREPKVFTINLGWKFLRIARDCGTFDHTALDRLNEIRERLEDRRRSGLTEKNMKLVRLVLTEGIWNEVTALPNILMQQARSDRDHAPVKAALTAQLAVAIAILTFAPVRLSNLVNIDLDINLSKPGGPGSEYWLNFPDYDVKNRVDLNFHFDMELTALIDEYVHDFRSVLLRGSNASWLFPGEAGRTKTASMFSSQITERIQKAVGIRITTHQFRHAAAAYFLKHKPGDYETVRRLLGHRSIQTTINFYCGLQTIQATEQYGRIIRGNIDTSDHATGGGIDR